MIAATGRHSDRPGRDLCPVDSTGAGVRNRRGGGPRLSRQLFRLIRYALMLQGPQSAMGDRKWRPMAMMSSGATLRLGQVVLYIIPPDDVAVARSRRDVFHTMCSLWPGTSADFISIVLNQSGRDQETADMAKTVLGQVAHGQLNPTTDPDLVWLLEHRALTKILGRDFVYDMLTSFEFPLPKIRPRPDSGARQRVSTQWPARWTA